MSHRPTRRPFRSWVFPLAVCAGTVLASAPGRAAVEWHPDVETAHAAARLSHRPVLAVFVAAWGTTAHPIESTCLGSPESEAVLATCFEPVRIDIDEHADLTRTAGVTHVPTACVLAADGTAIERFEMPGSSADFVKAAILAAQRAATHLHGTGTSESLDQSADARSRPAPEPTSVTASAFGSAVEPVTDATRPARGSLSRVTAKVRDLSAFAAADTPPIAPSTPAPPAAISQASRQVAEATPTVEPTSWPAETATTPPTAPAPTGATIEPAATAMTPSTVAPWLDAPAVRAAPSTPAAAPQPQGQAAALPPPERPAAPAEPAAGGLAAALQKPFALFGKQAADPPTLPPALPRSPLAGPAPAPAAAVADQAPDVHGSMPLGLEGYCPVTLVDRGSWTEGRAQWGARHRGRTYLFAGPEEQRTFLGNPDRYAPALSGDDPVLALDRGASTPGQRRYGVTYQARIYLFATPETREAFTGDPGRYVSRVAIAERPAPAGEGTRLY